MSPADMAGVWGATYNRALARGDDHGYAAHLADQAQERSGRKMSAKDAGAALDAALTNEKLDRLIEMVGELTGRLEALQASIDSIASLGSMSAGGTE